MRAGRVLSAALAATALLAAAAPPAAARSPWPDAARLRTLRDYVAVHGRRRVETLWLGSPDVGDGQGRAPYAWWPADHSLLNLTQFDSRSLYWLNRKGRIDLDHDVVPTPEDIAGSTYLVDRPWVLQVERACRHGRRLRIRRPGPSGLRAARRRLPDV